MTVSTEMTIRQPSKYERKKWYDKYDRFDAPEYIEEGTEWSEMMYGIVHAEQMGSSYGMSDELELHLQVEILDQYYNSIRFIYSGDWGYDSEELGLPSIELVRSRHQRAISLGVDNADALRMAIDWAMRWREAHAEEFRLEQERKRLESELSRLKHA